jgi:hypothetical protein
MMKPPNKFYGYSKHFGAGFDATERGFWDPFFVPEKARCAESMRFAERFNACTSIVAIVRAPDAAAMVHTANTWCVISAQAGNPLLAKILFTITAGHMLQQATPPLWPPAHHSAT